MRAVSIAASNDGGNTSNVKSNAVNSNNTRFQSLETMVLAFSSSSSPSTSTTIKEQLQQVQSSSASNNSISSTNDNDTNTTSEYAESSTTSKKIVGEYAKAGVGVPTDKHHEFSTEADF
jgi:hypothetical protein